MRLRPVEWLREDLRKTARGASSPAKPALHIPELSIVSSCPLQFLADRAAAEKLGRLCVGAGAGSPSTAGMAGVAIRGELTHCR
jgi:hypothetical protein